LFRQQTLADRLSETQGNSQLDSHEILKHVTTNNGANQAQKN